MWTLFIKLTSVLKAALINFARTHVYTMYKPIPEIISRDPNYNGISDTLNKFSAGLESAVDFGSNILDWDGGGRKGSDEQLPIMLMFRHFIELLDSISILIKHSSPDPAKLILRGALETYFGIEYLLEDDTHNRSMAFLVWHTRKNLKAYSRLDSTTQSGKQLTKTLEKDKVTGDLDFLDVPHLDKAIKNLESLIQRPEYADANKEYDKLIASGEKKPQWFRLFDGPKNVEQLADHLNLQSFYEILYRNYSGPTHGTDIIQGKISESVSNGVDIVQIRNPKDAQTVTTFALTLSIRIYRIFIEARIPERQDDHKKWYESIRKLYLQICGDTQFIIIK